MAPESDAPWTELVDFTESAKREFLALPSDVRDSFIAVFPAFATHPTRWSPEVDVGRVRNFPGRWRLSVRGYRGVYLILHARPTFERFDMGHEVYKWLIQQGQKR